MKVGDKLKCVEPPNDSKHLTLGGPWTVASVDPGGFVKLVELLGALPGHNYKFSRFVPWYQESAAPRKDDQGKLDITLLDDMPRAIRAVVEVMQWAIEDKKPTPYGRGSWQGVSADRYRAAVLRHNLDATAQAKASGELVTLQCDKETHMLHLAHQATSALMALEITLREMEAAA